jgi:hypothetical protein
MDRVFAAQGYVTVPDGTDVCAFLNATDLTQDVPWGALGDLSIAAGRIGAGRESWVHMHPVVTVVTYLIQGRLTIRMKEPEAEGYYELSLTSRQAAVAEPGTLVQLRNQEDVDAEVLYIASPSYVFEVEGDRVLYDDAVLVAESWEDVAVNYDRAAALLAGSDVKRRRMESLRRLAREKGVTSVES